MQGELYLARSTRRRFEPRRCRRTCRRPWRTPTPTAGSAPWRSCGSRLLSENLPVAAGARAALVRVAEADTRLVAESAAEALRQLRLSVTPGELSFGPLPPGRPSDPQRLETAGPPLARAATATSSQDWTACPLWTPATRWWSSRRGPDARTGVSARSPPPASRSSSRSASRPRPPTGSGRRPTRPPGRQKAAPAGRLACAGTGGRPRAGSAGRADGTSPDAAAAGPASPALQEPAIRQEPAVAPRVEPQPPTDEESVEGAELPPRATSMVGWLSVVVAAPLAVADVLDGLQRQDPAGLVYVIHPVTLVVAGLVLVVGRR